MMENITAALKKFIQNLLKKKTPDEIIETAKNSELKKTLNAFDLIMLGIGAVIGTGIFTIIGIAMVGEHNSPGAGPAVIVSMIIAMFACLFSALCYSEFASCCRLSLHIHLCYNGRIYGMDYRLDFDA